MKTKPTCNGRNGVGMKENKNKEVVEQAHNDQSTTNLYSTNTREVGPWLTDLEDVVWWRGVKSLFSISSQGLF